MTTPDRDFDLLTEEVRRLRQRVENMLSRKGGYVDGMIRTSAGSDIYANNDGRGVATRFINPRGVEAWTAHFRPDETTGPGNGSLSGYAWQGAPFIGAPGSAAYDYRNEYLRIPGMSAGQRAFMSTAITNAAASWQNKGLYGRFTTGQTKEIGFRIDNGGDNNYAEAYVDGLAVDGTISFTFRYRTGGGAVTTVTSGITIPRGVLLNIVLRNVYSGGNYSFGGYLLSEPNELFSITGFSTGTVGWAPAAGRAGILIKNAGNPGHCDWFYSTFT